uniref:tRNA (adenine(58)-N(1))-methyltransferase non-catalytic subunit TRM6 n=1 Tax=Panagrolaimus sp. ES5 TaxID=591445 RepID=A0AC34FVH9_9BILA
MDHSNHNNVNDHSSPKSFKSEEKMDSATHVPSRKRKISHSFDTASAKRSFTGADFCDQSASPSYVSCSTSYLPASFVHHTPVRMTNEFVDEVCNNYSDIRKHIPAKHPIFSNNAIINIMTCASVTPGNRILVYDELGGMATVSALKLLKDDGEIWFLFERFSSQSCPAFKAIDSSKELNTFRLIRLSTITNVLPSAITDGSSKLNTVIDDESMDCEDGTVATRPRRLEFIPEKTDILPRFETILILSDMISPVSFLETFYNFLLPSASIVVFTHSLEEAQMVQAFLVAAKAKGISVESMSTFRGETTEHGHFIHANKS